MEVNTEAEGRLAMHSALCPRFGRFEFEDRDLPCLCAQISASLVHTRMSETPAPQPVPDGEEANGG